MATLRAVSRRGALALVASLATNAFLVWVVRTTGVVDPLPPLAYFPVSLLTVAGVVGASTAYAILARRFERPTRPFALLTWGVLLLSFVPSLVELPSLPGSSTGAIAILMFMHVTVAVICYVSLTR